MFEFIKNFWREIFALTKTWSIRKQMLFCYVVAMTLILILLLIVVVINLFYIRYETVSEIDNTLNQQAKQNMLQLVKETAVLMGSQINQVTVMFEFIQNMIYAMNSTETYSLMPLLSYKPSELPEKCWVYDSNNQKVCLTFSSYINYTNIDLNNMLLQNLSTLDNVWYSVYKLTANIALRYYMYFYKEHLFKNFPGMVVQPNFVIENLPWYKIFNKTRDLPYTSSEYADNIIGDTNHPIITVVYPLFNKSNDTWGFIAADLPLNISDFMLKEIYSVNYLETGFTTVAYKNSSLIDPMNKFWKNEISPNFIDIDEYVWNQLSNKQQNNETYFFIYNKDIYRVAGYPLSISLNETDDEDNSDWWYMILLIAQESDVMKYREESKEKINTMAKLLIGITITCSVITVAVVTALIHFLARSITAPLKGIKEFTDKINSKATEKDMVTKEELDELKEGDDQVADLVKTYKQLAGSLITRREEHLPKPLQTSQNRIFPRNELYQKNKLKWKMLIDKIPN
ncbi:hypothetical protein SteCoe_34297 [Stentor coeruleus]|uniref:Cache domain-containing protein n=1 Tax=Stentor coeruleus TaxID=5963 RepID=A0A1R2AUU8_9CILI|nr:hypothetical protein SteCoe_34297 [Stentor coeruleus]